MQVLHVRSSNGFFGAESVLVTLLTQLGEEGVENKLLILSDYITGNEEFYQRALGSGINVEMVACGSKLDISTLRSIKKALAGLDNPIVHTHDVKSNLYGFLVSLTTKVRLVTTLHGWTSDTRTMRMYEALDRWFISRFDRIVSVSDSIVGKLGRKSRDKTTLIPNGVNTTVFTPEKTGFGREFWSLPDNGYVYGIVARLTGEKGHALLLESFSLLQDEPGNAVLLLVGSGPEEKNLRDQAQALGITDKVHFAGTCAEIDRALHDIDCYVSPSSTEGMPMILLEAMASGVPVIGTAVGSVPELLHDGAGYLVETRTPEAFSAAMSHMQKHSEQSAAMAEKARARVVEQFSAQAQSSRYRDLYRGLLNAAG